jgi:hypothetical protein
VEERLVEASYSLHAVKDRLRATEGAGALPAKDPLRDFAAREATNCRLILTVRRREN